MHLVTSLQGYQQVCVFQVDMQLATGQLLYAITISDLRTSDLIISIQAAKWTRN